METTISDEAVKELPKVVQKHFNEGCEIEQPAGFKEYYCLTHDKKLV